MRRRLAKSSAKGGKKKNDALLSALQWTLGVAGALFLAWLLVLQGNYSGQIGLWINDHLVGLFGGARYLIPALVVYEVFQAVTKGKPSGRIVRAAAAVIALLSAATVLAVCSTDLGGSVGAAVQSVLVAGVGTFGAFALSLAMLLFALQVAFGIRWGKVAQLAAKLVAEDFKNWQKARKELSAQLAQATAGTAVLEGPVAQTTPPPPAKPVNVNEEISAPPKPAVAVKEIKAEPAPKPKPVAKDEGTKPSAEAPKGSPYAGYQLPSVQLLNPPPEAKGSGKPQEHEIQAAIASLETTLKNFEIEARVTGYAPGPVITRYELAPAPGVKVSSIVALENDIALALKAKGIRIIAPIPGKAAVGIEIPNQRPATVVLRELLESRQSVPADAPLLTFGLGLAADGQPKGADIQKMPHLLVAGATGSGKSVAIHSMILSILFRARPDEVKFLMIDPKRLELTFYDGIPHLFDPTQAADKVSVITNSKDAAKALTALVRLMEKRYEKFQLFGVRNIDSYNKEADKRGQPREFFIVVVIDELADLMLVAADSVEDSIQRLTQMARAVGIHLVLATQRPSVDVITGVIKANLPSRIALQVISKIDSKVILDTVGAEALQGKGDLLYLSSGAQKPERCQGAYVSEEEINRVVGHLKTQGKPDYPMLETMAAKGGAAEDLATLGVEPLEFSQALKLVLERRRVSQDLLKSQFGSSARATNLLSALEVKGLIHKPEGTNRWEIHFDQIEDYLRQHFPQVPIDGPR